MHHPTYRIIHTTAFVTPVVEHCLEREIAYTHVYINTYIYTMSEWLFNDTPARKSDRLLVADKGMNILKNTTYRAL